MSGIDFEGQIVKPDKKGFFHCPFHCGRPDYPQPKWKTEKGFRGHMETCPARPSAIKARQEYEQMALAVEEAKKRDALAATPYKIGDAICYVQCVIVKDTHEQRGTRMVRVRYEPVKRFHPQHAVIRSVGFNGSIFFNEGIHPNDICFSMEDAERVAAKRQADYDRYLKDCADCR